jgi:hypothetical protein
VKREDLRPGDVMFGPIHGAAGFGARWGLRILGQSFTIGPLRIAHMGMVTQGGSDPRVAQAMPGGAQEIPIGDEHFTSEYAYCRPKWKYEKQGEKAAWHARQMVLRGAGYSILSYPALAVWKFGYAPRRLEEWINRRDEDGYLSKAICSVLVDDALTKSGLKVMIGVPHACVTPGAFAERMLETVGDDWLWCHDW